MGTYIVQADVENLYGTDNVARWSQLDNDVSTADTDRIASAIQYAEADVEARMRGGPYAIPFSGTAAALDPLKEAMAIKAGEWLYRTRGLRDSDEQTEKMAARVDAANATLAALHANQRQLDIEKSDTFPTAPVVI